MSYKIETIAPFRKGAKKLLKKHPSFKDELNALGKELKDDPTKGSSLGNNCYKIRITIKSKGRGKSGGARIITHVVHVADQIVYLIAVYDKSDQDNISNKELLELLKHIY
jgi:hypothetical protein